jgi:hypothetical protein
LADDRAIEGKEQFQTIGRVRPNSTVVGAMLNHSLKERRKPKFDLLGIKVAPVVEEQVNNLDILSIVGAAS